MSRSLFVLADGVIGYRLLQQGKLKDLRVLNTFFVVFFALAVLCVAAFLLFWRAGGYDAHISLKGSPS